MITPQTWQKNKVLIAKGREAFREVAQHYNLSAEAIKMAYVSFSAHPVNASHSYLAIANSLEREDNFIAEKTKWEN